MTVRGALRRLVRLAVLVKSFFERFLDIFLRRIGCAPWVFGLCFVMSLYRVFRRLSSLFG